MCVFCVARKKSICSLQCSFDVHVCMCMHDESKRGSEKQDLKTEWDFKIFPSAPQAHDISDLHLACVLIYPFSLFVLSDVIQKSRTWRPQLQRPQRRRSARAQDWMEAASQSSPRNLLPPPSPEVGVCSLHPTILNLPGIVAH